MAKVEEQKFHFAIGKPWSATDPHGSVGFYTYGSEIFYCTLNEAIGLRDSFNEKAKTGFFPDDTSRGTYRIYQLSEVPNSEHMQQVEMPEVKRVRKPKKKIITPAQIKAAVDALPSSLKNNKKLPPKTKKT